MDDNRFFVTETPNTRPRFTIQVANALYESKRRDIPSEHPFYVLIKLVIHSFGTVIDFVHSCVLTRTGMPDQSASKTTREKRIDTIQFYS